MTAIKTFTSVLMLAASLTATMASAESRPSYARLRSLTAAGSGCPAGSVDFSASLDFSAFTLDFDSYIAEVGPHVGLAERRKNCQIVLDLSVPYGWSYAVVSLDYRGYVDIDRGVTAEQQTMLYFQGQSGSGVLRSVMTGPLARNYAIHDVIGNSGSAWSPCGATRALNINTQVRLSGNNRNASGIITVDTVRSRTSYRYGIQWRRCS